MSRRDASAVAGSAGEKWAKAVFGDMGWLVSVPESGDDLGTDMLLQPVNDRGELMPLVLGVQVKSAITCRGGHFRDKRQARWEDLPRLWRVSVNKNRARDWLRSASPYLLVLWCQEHKRGYWSHVTGESARFTRRGASVEVSSSHELAEEAAPEILECVARAGGRLSWEGSLGVSPDVLTPADVLRAALLTPRLVAPRPGTQLGSLEPHVAIAVLVQMREEDLDGGPGRRFAEVLGQELPALPVPEDPSASDVWAWRFYAAARQFVSHGRIDSSVG